MPPLGALASAAFLLAVMAVFGLLVHLLAVAGGEGLSIASGVVRGVRAWATAAPEPPPPAASSPESAPSVPAHPVSGSIALRR